MCVGYGGTVMHSMEWGGGDVGDDMNGRMCRSGLMFYFPDCGQS